MRLQNTNEVEILQIDPDGTTVTIKKKMTWGDHQRLASRGTKMTQSTGETGAESAELEADVGLLNLLYLQVNLVSWTVKGAEGHAIAPLSLENIGKLPPEVADYLLEEIQKRNPRRTKEQRDEIKNLSAMPSTTSPEETTEEKS